MSPPEAAPQRAGRCPALGSGLVWTVAAACGALLAYGVLVALESLADLSAAVHLMT